MRKPYTDVWVVYVSDPNAEGERGEDILFTYERAARVFARWAKSRWPVVVGPNTKGVYRSGSFAIRVERDNAPKAE